MAIEGGYKIFERVGTPLIDEVQDSKLVVFRDGVLVGRRQTKP